VSGAHVLAVDQPAGDASVRCRQADASSFARMLEAVLDEHPSDREPPARRVRALSLDQLVAGVLILYPTYVSRSRGAFTAPERALDELLQWRTVAGVAACAARAAHAAALAESDGAAP